MFDSTGGGVGESRYRHLDGLVVHQVHAPTDGLSAGPRPGPLVGAIEYLVHDRPPSGSFDDTTSLADNPAVHICSAQTCARPGTF
jgi:hypothetical protein